MKFGLAFNNPSRKALKQESLAKPAKVFVRDELKAIYASANEAMRAFMLLALKGGMGGSIGLLEKLSAGRLSKASYSEIRRVFVYLKSDTPVRLRALRKRNNALQLFAINADSALAAEIYIGSCRYLQINLVARAIHVLN